MTRGLMIAAPRSGSGKTTLTLGLLRAFRRRSVAVVGLKSGPDYIDPAFHAAASGCEGVNLDSWAMAPELLRSLAAEATAGRALALCEASMGLFDGVPAPRGRSGASADVAAALGLPVLLVVDVSGQAQSAAAVVKGCAAYDERIRIAGVVINRVGSERHRRLVAQAIEAQEIPVVGALPRDDRIVLPERHLGLVQAHETEALDARLEAIADFVEERLDCMRLLALAGDLDCVAEAPRPALRPPGQRIALPHDAAFSFVYPHLLRGWRAAGAEIVAFSPLADEPPPPACDACWLPGGYPELHAGKLAAARRFLEGLRRFAETKPVHGECGGYMALGACLVDFLRRGACDGGAAFRPNELRQAPHDARLSRGEAHRRLRARARRDSFARPRVPLCDDRRRRRGRAFRSGDGRLRRRACACRVAARPRHRVVLPRDCGSVSRPEQVRHDGPGPTRGDGSGYALSRAWRADLNPAARRFFGKFPDGFRKYLLGLSKLAEV